MATNVGAAEVLVEPVLDKAAAAAVNRQLKAAMQKIPPVVIRPQFGAGRFVGNTEVTKVAQNLTQAFQKAGGDAGRLFNQGVTNGLRSAVGGIERNITRIQRNLKNLSRDFQNAGFQGYLMGQALTRAFTLPIGAAVGFGNAFGIKVAANLESAQVALKALLPPGYDVESLLKRLQKLAIESPVFNTQQVTQFTRQLVGAGVEGKRAVQVVEALGKIFQAYGLSSFDAEKATRGVYQAFAKGKLYAEELNQQISENIPATLLFAKAAQRLGLITNKNNESQRKAAIATQTLALKQRELAIYQQKVAASGKPMTAAQKLHIDRLQLQITKLADAKKKADAAADGSKNLQASFLQLVKEGKITADVLDDIIVEVGKMPEVARGSAAATNTMQFAWDRLKDSFQNAFANAFLKFSPQVQTALNTLTANAQEFADAIVSTSPAIIDFFSRLFTKTTELIRAYNDLSPSQKTFVKDLLLILASLGPIAFIMGRFATVLGGVARFMYVGAGMSLYLARSLYALRSAEFAAAGGATLLSRTLRLLWITVMAPITLTLAVLGTTLGIVVLAVLGLGIAAFILYKKWKPFHDLVNTIGRAIKTGAVAAFEALKTATLAVAGAAVWFYQHALLPVWHALQAAGGFIKSVALTVFHALETAFSAVGKAIQVVLTHLRPFFLVAQTGFLILAKIFEIVFKLILVGLYYIGQGFLLLWRTAVKPILNFMVAGFQFLKDKVTLILRGLAFLFKAVWDQIYIRFIKPFIDTFRGPAVATAQFFKDKITIIWDGLKKGAKATWDFIKIWFIKPLIDGFKQLPKIIGNVVDFLGGIIDGIGKYMLRSAQWAVRILNSLIRILNKIPGIKHIDPLGVPGVGRPPIDTGGRRPISGQIAGAAKGTPAQGAPAGWMWVGEKGPELMYFQGGEHVIPNDASKAMAKQWGGYANGTPDWVDFLLNPAKKVMSFVGDKLAKVIQTGVHSFGNATVALARLGAGGFVNLLKSAFGGAFGGRAVGGGIFGPWPASPGAQRGDSGVWRRIVALIRSTGPVSGSFGNAYRPGDPLWHGSGRAVDWMGYNQDRLAAFLAALKPLELIHRTANRDYAYTRGRNMGSFNNSLMEAHRNHIHVAFDNGGWLPPGLTSVYNGTGRNEMVLNSAQAAVLTDQIGGDGSVIQLWFRDELVTEIVDGRILRNNNAIIRAMNRGVS